MVCIFLADGFEEMEAIIPRDILKRGGVDVCTVGVGGEVVTSAYGLSIKTDMTVENVDFNKIEGIILPGGMPGTTNLEQNKKVIEIINHCNKNKIMIGAICAAPSILGKLGILEGKLVCCYPGFEKYLKGAEISEEKVAKSGHIITSKGPGTAINFGFELLDYIKGDNFSDKVKKGMVYSA